MSEGGEQSDKTTIAKIFKVILLSNNYVGIHNVPVEGYSRNMLYKLNMIYLPGAFLLNKQMSFVLYRMCTYIALIK